MREKLPQHNISLSDIDSVLKQALHPFRNSRLDNSIRFALSHHEESDRVRYTISCRAQRIEPTKLPSLQISARFASQGIIIQYEILPEGVSDELLFDKKYSFGYLKGMIADALQFFFLAISRARHCDSLDQEITPAESSLQSHPCDQPPEAPPVTSPPTEDEPLESLDLFDYSDFQDNSVDTHEPLEPLHLDL